MTERETVEGRLARLARATDGLKPSPGFSTRVATRIAAEAAPASWRARGIALALFAAAAAAAVGLSLDAQASLDEQALSSFEIVEIEP